VDELDQIAYIRYMDSITTQKANGMLTFIVAVRFDYRKFTVIVKARTAQAAVNKARRIWPCYVIESNSATLKD